MSGEQFSYDDRFLAYIDILGWTKIVDRSAKGSREEAGGLADVAHVLRALRTLPRSADAIQAQIVDNGGNAEFALVVSLFSDTAVITSKPTVIGLFTLLGQVRRFCLELMKAGFFTRGAIVRGDVYHGNGDIVGPALVEAYRLEDTVANFPRILLADDVLPFLRPPFVAMAEQDRDTLWILNPFLDVYPNPRISSGAPILIREVLARAKKNQHDNKADVAIRAKMGWLISFLTDLLECPV